MAADLHCVGSSTATGVDIFFGMSAKCRLVQVTMQLAFAVSYIE